MNDGSESAQCLFFSSRRRHTRWRRDWSSDVCSSDLPEPEPEPEPEPAETAPEPERQTDTAIEPDQVQLDISEHVGKATENAQRSEERRVGKECRTRWRAEP